ncbi:MAG: MOSC domain-containing protein [Methylocystaceae bacterium]
METSRGKVVAVNTSEKKGTIKHNVGEAYLETELGLVGDAHAGFAHRQVSLLALSSVEKMRQMGADVEYGSFAENLTVDGLDLKNLPIGTKMHVGEAWLEVTQIGKECHNKGCAIKQQVGTCVMPIEGIFARVLSPGWVRVGDEAVLI